MPDRQSVSYRHALALLLLLLVVGGGVRAIRPLLVLVAWGGLALVVVVGALAGEVYLSRLAEQRLAGRSDGGSQPGGGGAGQGRQQGRRPIVPPLYFTSRAAWSMRQTKAAWEASGDPSRFTFPGAPPFLSSAINTLLSLILRDFVVKWYSAFSDSPVFPAAVEATIRDTLVSLVARVDKLDWADLLVGRILPLLTSHIETFRSAEQAQLGALDSDELDLFVASRYASRKGGKLHAAVDVASTNSRPSEEAWLRSLIDSILPLIIPDRELDSPAVRIMVRELVSCTVMLPIFDMLGDPDFYNRIIDDKAGAAIRDQQVILPSSRVFVLTSAVQAHVRKTEAVTVRTSARQFEGWLKGISQISDVRDAKRLRSDLTGQIRKAKSLTDGKNLEEVVDGVKVTDWVDYIERLYSAKRKVDRRIAKLGGVVGSSRASVFVNGDVRTASTASLRDILLEPAAVSYLMEFLERRQRSVRAQFWLLVEGLKDPLEDLDADKPFATSTAFHEATATATALEDVRMIWEAYLSANPFGSNVANLATIRSFVESGGAKEASPREVRQVRHALFSIQADVLALLDEEDFPSFQQSDLYFKALADFPSTPALPAVTFHAAFDARPNTRRSGSFDGSPIIGSLRKVSAGSLDATSGSISSVPGPGGGGGKRKTAALSDSLEFLMSPSTMEADRPALFGEPSADEAETAASAENESPPSDEDFVRVETIEAIQEALETILATSDRAQPTTSSTPGGKSTTSLASLSESSSPTATLPRRVSVEGDRRPLPPPRHPSLPGPTHSSPSSLRKELPVGGAGPHPPPPRRRPKAVFDDEESLEGLELDGEGGEQDAEFDPQNVRLAAPGDLHLPAEIARLAKSLEKLQGQEAVVAALIRKAELTGNTSELKILVKSRDSLRREIRAAAFQREQYEAQATENQLSPDRTRVSVPGTTVGQAGGQSFQLYLIEVHQLGVEGSFRSGWIVTRRYSEFATLNVQLAAKYSAARYLDFPSKRLVGTYSKEFIEQRRAALERYLQALVKIPVVCQSHELRAFLSQATIALPKTTPSISSSSPLPFFAPGQTLVRSLYRSVTSGIDDVLGTSTTSMMDQVIERLSQQAAEFAGLTGASANDEDLVGQLLADQSSTSSAAAAVADADTRIGEEGLTFWSAPIADLFITIFELKENNNWLRRQAILIVLQQVLGGTIERKFRDSIKMLLAPPQLVTYISALQNGLWPDGELKQKTLPRTAAEKAATKESANRKLAALMPDVAANLIGRHNARQGARRLFAVLQNRRLNKHLMYSIVDEVVAVLFPELKQKASSLGQHRPLFLS
ncbi:tRNA (guanine-N(7)-)-methyltransferase (tRNA(m7G46)-methyltransferase) [Rhodosporidiobolus nylandii]